MSVVKTDCWAGLYIAGRGGGGGHRKAPSCRFLPRVSPPSTWAVGGNRWELLPSLGHGDFHSSPTQQTHAHFYKSPSSIHIQAPISHGIKVIYTPVSLVLCVPYPSCATRHTKSQKGIFQEKKKKKKPSGAVATASRAHTCVCRRRGPSLFFFFLSLHLYKSPQPYTGLTSLSSLLSFIFFFSRGICRKGHTCISFGLFVTRRREMERVDDLIAPSHFPHAPAPLGPLDVGVNYCFFSVDTAGRPSGRYRLLIIYLNSIAR